MGADTPEISVPLATGRTDPRHDLAPTNPVQKAVQDNLEALQMSPQEKALQFHVKIREKKGTIESRYAANARGWLITAPSGATLFKCEPSDYEKDLDQKMLAGREHAIDNDAAHRDTYMKSSGQTFKPDQDEVSLGAAENSAKLPANEILPSEDVWPYNRIGQYNDAIRHGVQRLGANPASGDNDDSIYMLRDLCARKRSITRDHLESYPWEFGTATSSGNQSEDEKNRSDAIGDRVKTFAAMGAGMKVPEVESLGARAGGPGGDLTAPEPGSPAESSNSAESAGNKDINYVKGAAKSEPVTTSEPVSVANGEYLETWRDFLIRGVLAFDGARYMGLKMRAPTRYRSPLGACRISAFDEFVATPARGELEFHQADGKCISFDRPFNIMAASNAAYPHLQLRAPWLGKLALKDRTLVKYFKQYDDRFYRLEKIEDLNGNSLVFFRTQDGLLEKVEGSDGLALEFGNDAQRRRTIITLVGVDKSRLVLANYAYDRRGRMVAAECAFGMSVHYEWHATKPLLLRWRNATRRSETVFTYDDAGRVMHTATSGIWNDDRFRYDRDKRTTTYLPAGEEKRAQRFFYDEHENITAEIDALGGAVSHRYDHAGFRIATTDANGHSSRTRYDVRGNIRDYVDAEGRGAVYGWGPHGDINTIIDSAGCVRKFENDNKGNVLAAIDAEKNETRFERDARGRLTRTLFPDGCEERRVYDKHGRLWGVRDGKGAVTEFLYDVFGRLTERKAPDGGVTRLSYEAGAGGFATPTSVTRADGVTISRRFDAEGSLASVTDGEGRSWTYKFGAFEVLRAIVDPKGGRLAFSYDSEGRLTAVGNAVGQMYQLLRDAAGRVAIEEDFDGRRTHYTRDPGGRVIETVKPDGARLVYSYDKTDRVTRIESFAPGAGPGDKPQDITRFWYDGRGLLEKAENGAALVEYRRDKNGAIVAEALNGRWVESKRDAMGRRVERRIGDGLVAYAHDPLGLIEKIAIGDHAPLSFTRDVMGRETRRANGIGFKLDSAYDIAGQLIRQAGGFDVASFGLGVAGAMAAQAAGFAPGAGSQIERGYRWDKASAPLAIPDKLWGETAYAYDQNGQVSEARFGDALIEKFSYDAARNMAGAASSGPQAISGLGEDIGRLVAWKSSPGGLVQTARGPRGERLTLTHDKCGRVVERRVERDGFRAKVWRYEWDAFDRLIRCVTPDREAWRYGYDPFGRRVWKVKEFTEAEARSYVGKFPKLIDAARLPDRGATLAEHKRSRLDSGKPDEADAPPIVGVHFLWDGDVLAEEAPLRFDGAVDWNKATRWHYEPGTFRPLAKETPDGELLHIVTDHLGTPREMVDEKGDVRWAASYTTWGLVRGLKVAVPQAANDDYAGIGWRPGGGHTRATFGNLALKPIQEDAPEAYACPIRFQGQWQDEETGLYYNRHRHYDPLAGQYASPDPIGLDGGDRQQGYVQRPTSWVDPFGLSAAATPSGSQYSVAYEMRLGSSDLGKSRAIHFNRANAALDQAMDDDADFARAFEKLIPGARDAVVVEGGRKTPPGWVWHHDMQTGIMQLTPTTQHFPGSIFWEAYHPGGVGGYSTWAIPAGAPPN